MDIRFKYVVLEAPYENSNLPAIKNYFPKILSLKKNGYSKAYALGALPVDTTDFIGTHHLLLIEVRKGEWELALGYKTVSLARCSIYGLKFPALALAESSGATSHISYVKKIIDECHSKKLGLTYGGSWTSSPEYREQRILNASLRDMMSAMLVHYHRHEKFDHQICLGVPRFKTDQFFSQLGYESIQLDHSDDSSEKNLENSAKSSAGNLFPLSSLKREPVTMLHSKSPTPFGIELAEKYQDLWSNREIAGLKPENIINLAIEKDLAS